MAQQLLDQVVLNPVVTGTAAGGVVPADLRYFLTIDGLDNGATGLAVSSHDIGAPVAAMAGQAAFSPLTVTLPSIGLTGVLADLANRTAIRAVRLEGFTAVGELAYDLTLGNVSVSSYAETASDTKLSFDYQQVALTTRQINPTGTLGSPQTFSWDLTTHAAVSIPAPVPGPVGDSGVVPTGLRYFLMIDGLDSGP